MVDSDGDQPILQDEPGLTSGRSNERPTQKMLKTQKVQQTLCDKLSSAKLSDLLPSMEQQEDGLRGSHNLLFSTNDALIFILDL